MNKNNNIIVYLNELLKTNNNNNINKLLNYCEKCNINSKINLDVLKMIESDNLEELFIDKLLCKNLDKYYNLYNNIIEKNIIAKIYIYILINSDQYIKSNNIINETYIYDLFDNLLYNLKINLEEFKDDNILQQINNNTILFENLILMEPYKFNMNLWKKSLDRKNMIQQKKDNMPTSNLYKCKKCGAEESTIKQIQNRSADEPATITVTCVKCKYAFSFS